MRRRKPQVKARKNGHAKTIQPGRKQECGRVRNTVRKTDVKTSASVSGALEPNVQQGEKPKSFEMDEHDNNTDEEMMVCEKEGVHEAQSKVEW